MPTGYTESIKNGITFKQFIMQCARAMGACVEMRDDPWDKPIPEKFEGSTYHLDHLTEAQRELNRVRLMTDAEIEPLEERNRIEEIERIKQYALEKAELKLKYEAMLDQVNDWEPPSSDHENFKKFMQDQIKDSIDHDCDPNCCWGEAPIKKSVEEWRAARIKELEHDIEYHTKANNDEVKRVSDRNRWVYQLRQSIEKMPRRSRYEMLRRC